MTPTARRPILPPSNPPRRGDRPHAHRRRPNLPHVAPPRPPPPAPPPRRAPPASRPRATRSTPPRRKQPQPAPATKDAPPFPRHVVAAEDIPSRLSAILKQAQRHAIGIKKNNQPIAVLLAADLFQETMEQVEKDAILSAFLREIAYEKNPSANAEAPDIPNAEARMRSWNAAADDLPPHVLEMAQSNPVRIKRDGKPLAVLVSRHEYACLIRLEDIYWGARADAALAENDFMSAEESEAFLEEMMNAPD